MKINMSDEEYCVTKSSSEESLDKANQDGNRKRKLEKHYNNSFLKWI